MRHRKTACFGALFWNLILLNLAAASCYLHGKVLAAASSESFMVEKSIAGSGARAEPLRCDRHLNCIVLACRYNSSLFSDVGPLETIAENKTEQKSAAKRRQRLLKAPNSRQARMCVFPQRGAYS